MKTGVVSNIKSAMRLCSFLTVLFLLASCKGNQKVCDTCLHEIYAPLLHDEPTEYPIMSSLFERVDTVFLENAGVESIVPSVDEVIPFGDTIIVRSAETLFFFKSDGKFLSRFDRQGKGTGCYRKIERIDVNRDLGEFYVMDGYASRILVYGMDCSYRRQIGISGFVTDFAVLPNGDFLFSNPILYRDKDVRRGLWQTGPDGKFIRQIVSYDPEFAHVSINNPYINHISPDVIGFMGVEDNDRFYTYKADSISVTCRMTTDIVMSDEIRRSDLVSSNPKREYTKCGYLETPRFLYFVVTNYGMNLMMVLVDKSSWTTYRMYVYTAEFKQNSLKGEPFPFLVSSYNGTLVGFYDSGMVLESEQYRKIFPSITADSNPVLLFFRE